MRSVIRSYIVSSVIGYDQHGRKQIADITVHNIANLSVNITMTSTVQWIMLMFIAVDNPFL